MSTHPNAILLLVLTPDDSARKTFRAICAQMSIEPNSGDDFKIGVDSYHAKVMEDSYDDGWQISAPEGSIIVFNLVTYGYGEKIEWEGLDTQRRALAEWAAQICEAHKCSSEIFVTANYW